MKKLLADILCIPSESGDCDRMAEFIKSHCSKKGMTVTDDRRGNVYVTKGNDATYPCIVAHMDTVHHIEKGGIGLIEIGDRVTGINPMTMEQTGVGGDDKCGIYAAIRCLEGLPACKAVFFVDEEVGCIGSSDCDLAFFVDCRFVLQADRRGNSDWVTDISGPLGSKTFQDAVKPYLKKHGFSPCHGMMSDVMALRDSQVGVSVANMSAGYYNPHQACEYVNTRDLNNVVSLMLAICKNLTASYPFTYTEQRYVKTFRTRDFMWPEHNRAPQDADREPFPDWEPMDNCECCFEEFKESKLCSPDGKDKYCHQCAIFIFASTDSPREEEESR